MAAERRAELAAGRVPQPHGLVVAAGARVLLSSPQIGIARAAAIVQPPGDAPAVILLNPRITTRSDEVDEQYEGCQSFFDVRGLVPHPLKVTIETANLSGEIVTIRGDHRAASLMAFLLRNDQRPADVPASYQPQGADAPQPPHTPSSVAAFRRGLPLPVTPEHTPVRDGRVAP